MKADPRDDAGGHPQRLAPHAQLLAERQRAGREQGGGGADDEVRAQARRLVERLALRSEREPEPRRREHAKAEVGFRHAFPLWGGGKASKPSPLPTARTRTHGLGRLSAGVPGATSDGCMALRARSRNPFVNAIALVLDVARRHRFRVALIGGFALPFHGVQRATGDVDFLADAGGSDALDDALIAAGARRLHRSADAANYARGTSHLAAIDFIFARRARAQDMLRRARGRLLRGARIRVPVVDAEAVIGLKLQAVANAPGRRIQDEADIRALFAARGGSLDVDVLRDYFRLFDRESDLDRLLEETKTG